MKTAVFTGAGASAAVGYPLTKDLLPRVRDELKSGELFDDTNGPPHDADDRKELQRMLVALLPGFHDVDPEGLPSITDIFSLVEYAIVSNEALPVGDHDALLHLRRLLKQAIMDVILREHRAPYGNGGEAREQEQLLADFVRWYRSQGDEVGLVSTNYDISLEHELYAKFEGDLPAALDLGFDWRDVGTGDVRTRPARPKLRIHKLHGSLDVLRCARCGHVYFNAVGAIVVQAFRRETDGANSCHCSSHRLELHIVSPSTMRDVREVNLLSIWRNAFEWLRRADRWVVVGYSLPAEDLAIRSLLLRAFAARTAPPEVIVVQRGDGARATYKTLFPRARYEPGGLRAFLPRHSPTLAARP